MRGDKRRKLLVEGRIQGALARQLILHWVVFVGITALICLAALFLWEPLLRTAEPLRVLRIVLVLFVVVAACLLPVVIRDSIKLSNRFVGPVVRLRSLLQEVARGEEVTPFELRKRDFWQDLPDDVHALLHRIQQLEESPRDAPDRETEELQPVGA